jgi:23S rRNA (cytosine1962-C5)-methyltransferase
VVVNGHSASWLARGFCWVYPNEVTAKPKGLSPGAVVPLQGPKGEDLGAGVWDSGWIAVRRFRTQTGPVDEAWLDHLVGVAQALRDQLVDPGTSAYRVVNAENDGLPGVRVDRYGWVIVVTLDSPSLLSLLEPLADVLEARFSPRAVYLAWRPDPRDKGWKTDREAGLVRGRAPTSDVPVTERGVAARVRPGARKDIGLYPDVRELRAWLEPHWGGRTVLNLFAHTGFFSVVAAFHGASHVTSVDLSAHFLTRAEDNFRANELDPGLHDFIAEDVRRFLDRARRKGERFDRVLLDPPAFAHGPDGALSTKKSYGSLVAACLRVLEPGGWLIAVLNQGVVSPRDFHGMVADGAKRAGRPLQLVHEAHQAGDFPALLTFPEGRYLKAGVWRSAEPDPG